MQAVRPVWNQLGANPKAPAGQLVQPLEFVELALALQVKFEIFRHVPLVTLRKLALQEVQRL